MTDTAPVERGRGFWIDVALLAAAVGLSLASIFMVGAVGWVAFGVGTALFLPACIRLASRFAPEEVVAHVAPSPSQKRPILWAGFIVVAALLQGSENLQRIHQPEHRWFGWFGLVVCSLGGIWGAVELVRAVRREVRRRREAARSAGAA